MSHMRSQPRRSAKGRQAMNRLDEADELPAVQFLLTLGVVLLALGRRLSR